MFGLFRSQAKRDRAEAKQYYELTIEVLRRIKTNDLKPKMIYKVSAASVIAESFLKELDRVADAARARLPPHCSKTPLSLSPPNYLRAEAEKAFQDAEKVADQIGFEPFAISSTNYLLGAYILCHAWDISDDITADDLLKGDYSLGMWKAMLSEKLKDFLIEAGVKEDVASRVTEMR